MYKLTTVILSVLFVLLAYQPASADAPLPYEYTSPMAGASVSSAGTTITMRPGPALAPDSVTDVLIVVQGESSGLHMGTTVLAQDGKSLIFRPDQPFAAGERVTVRVNEGMVSVAGDPIPPASFDFTVSKNGTLPAITIDPYAIPGDEDELEQIVQLVSPASTDPISRTYVTLGTTFPPISITISPAEVADGFIFAGPIPTLFSPLILDNQGEPVFYDSRPFIIMDFKRQPNGLLTYYDRAKRHFEVMDNHYTVVDTIQAGNGYEVDLHELQLLPNGNAVFMIYDEQQVDMSEIVAGGVPTATVVNLVLQELDPDKNVVFEWHSLDHIPISDTTRSLLEQRIDYVHGNAIEVDTDGNWLVSGATLDEIFKVNRQTGEIMWRLSGKRNQFTFVNDPRNGFSRQHHIRRLENGNITLFDNSPQLTSSRALEYELDEQNKIATLVWEYQNTPPVRSPNMGSVQRLPNGNTLVGWGGANVVDATEVTPAGDKVFEMEMSGITSYRFFRQNWQGFPSWAPTLVARNESGTLKLYFSWNGATEIASYKIYGGKDAPTNLVATLDKSGFETMTTIDPALAQEYCYWQVMPVDKEGQETRLSNIGVAHGLACDEIYVPQVLTE